VSRSQALQAQRAYLADEHLNLWQVDPKVPAGLKSAALLLAIAGFPLSSPSARATGARSLSALDVWSPDFVADTSTKSFVHVEGLLAGQVKLQNELGAGPDLEELKGDFEAEYKKLASRDTRFQIMGAGGGFLVLTWFAPVAGQAPTSPMVQSRPPLADEGAQGWTTVALAADHRAQQGRINGLLLQLGGFSAIAG